MGAKILGTILSVLGTIFPFQGPEELNLRFSEEGPCSGSSVYDGGEMLAICCGWGTGIQGLGHLSQVAGHL